MSNNSTASKKEKTKRVHVLPWLQKVASNPEFEGIELYQDANGTGFRISDKRKVMRDYATLRSGSPCDDRETYLYFERFDSCVGKHFFKRQGRKTDPELVYILPREEGFFGKDELRLPSKNKRKRTRETRRKKTNNSNEDDGQSVASSGSKKRTSRSGSNDLELEDDSELIQGAKRMKLNNGQSMPLQDQMSLFIAVCKRIVASTDNDAKLQEDALLQAATSASDLAAVTQLVSSFARRGSRSGSSTHTSSSSSSSSNSGYEYGHHGHHGRSRSLTSSELAQTSSISMNSTGNGKGSNSSLSANTRFVPSSSEGSTGVQSESDAMMHQYLAQMSENISHDFKLSFTNGGGKNVISSGLHSTVNTNDSMSVESDDLRSETSVDTSATQREFNSSPNNATHAPQLLQAQPQMLYQDGYDRRSRGHGHQRNLSNSSYSSMLTAVSDMSEVDMTSNDNGNQGGDKFGMSSVSAAAAAAAMMLTETDFDQRQTTNNNNKPSSQTHQGGQLTHSDVDQWQMESLTSSFNSFSTHDGTDVLNGTQFGHSMSQENIPQMVNMFTNEEFLFD